MDSKGKEGAILKVNLTENAVTRESTAPYADRFIGGRAVGAKILYDELRPGADPLGPGNVLLFNNGPLSGTAAPSSGRVDVSAKSPMNNFHGVTNFGGFWGAELRHAGYAHLVIQGAREEPVFLLIENERVEVRDAKHLWGLDTYETAVRLRHDLGDPGMQVLSIGPAGENLVRFASIATNLGNVAGRTGMGAVMGSKKLKAIAVRGTRGVSLAQPKRFLDIARDLHRLLRESPAFEENNRVKPVTDAMFNKLYENMLAFGNYEDGRWEKFARIEPEKFFSRYQVRRAGCFACPMQCMHLVDIPESGYGIAFCSPFMSFLGTVWNDDLMAMWEAIILANKLGLDVIETGGMIAFLMELYQKGLITGADTDGLPLEKGSRRAILQIIRKIALREGVGDTLAEGGRRAAEAFGPGALESLVSVKGHFPHGYQFTAFEGASLMQAVGGADPFPTYGTGVEIRLSMPGPKEKLLTEAKDLFGSEDAYLPGNYGVPKVRMVIDAEHRARIPDILGVCIYVVDGFNKTSSDYFLFYDRLAELYRAATGRPLSRENLFSAAERLVNTERCLDAREGIGREHDRLPERFFRSFPVGANKGKALDPEKMEAMKTAYYRERGWDTETGLPTPEKLRDLKLEDFITGTD
jgi:aldehyde:ferredoxin oxidoreductase